MKLRIGELAKMAGCRNESIRYYEKMELLKPARTTGNYREYNDKDLDRLRFIVHCRKDGLALKEIKKLLEFRDDPSRECGYVHDLIDKRIENIEAKIAYLETLRKELYALSKASSCEKRGNCSILHKLGAVDSCSFCQEMLNYEQPSKAKARKRRVLEDWLSQSQQPENEQEPVEVKPSPEAGLPLEKTSIAPEGNVLKIIKNLPENSRDQENQENENREEYVQKQEIIDSLEAAENVKEEVNANQTEDKQMEKS